MTRSPSASPVSDSVPLLVGTRGAKIGMETSRSEMRMPPHERKILLLLRGITASNAGTWPQGDHSHRTSATHSILLARDTFGIFEKVQETADTW